MIITLKLNIHIFSGSTPFVMFAKASIFMNRKIQTLCVKTNVSVSFTPPEVMDEEIVKILYYDHQNFTICQRVVEIRMNEGIQDSSKQLEPDFSKVYTQKNSSGVSIDFYLYFMQLFSADAMIFSKDFNF